MFFAEIEYYPCSIIGFFKISRSVSKLIVILLRFRLYISGDGVHVGGGVVDLAVSLAFRSSVLANRTLETIRNGDRWTICLWYLCNCKLNSEEGQGQVGRGSKSHVIIEGEGVKNVLIRFTWFVHFPKNAYSPGKYCASCISIFDLIAPIPNLQPWVLLAR